MTLLVESVVSLHVTRRERHVLFFWTPNHTISLIVGLTSMWSVLNIGRVLFSFFAGLWTEPQVKFGSLQKK